MLVCVGLYSRLHLYLSIYQSLPLFSLSLCMPLSVSLCQWVRARGRKDRVTEGVTVTQLMYTWLAYLVTLGWVCLLMSELCSCSFALPSPNCLFSSLSVFIYSQFVCLPILVLCLMYAGYWYRAFIRYSFWIKKQRKQMILICHI